MVEHGKVSEGVESDQEEFHGSRFAVPTIFDDQMKEFFDLRNKLTEGTARLPPPYRALQIAKTWLGLAAVGLVAAGANSPRASHILRRTCDKSCGYWQNSFAPFAQKSPLDLS